MYISSGNHPDSFLSGSTIERMIDKAKELGHSYFAVTDNGYLTGVLRAYNYAQKKGIKLIPGVEAYFKDKNCDISKGSESIKYFKVVIHCQDQIAYQELVKLCSDFSNSINILDHKYPLFDWNKLKHLSNYNVTISTADVEDIVSKHLLTGKAENALKTYKKLKEIFGNRYYPALIPSSFDKYWNDVIEVKSEGGSFKIGVNDRVDIKNEKKATGKTILTLLRLNKPCYIEGVYINKVRFNVKQKYQKVLSATSVSEFSPIPGGDLQLKANKFIYALAERFGDLDRLLINNYSYYAAKEDKIVQNMRLSESKRVAQEQHLFTSEEMAQYLETIKPGISEKISQNSIKWASGFDDFKLKYEYLLPDVGENPEEQFRQVIDKVGRMKWDDERYVKQFNEEFDLLTKNGVVNLIPYFLPIVDISNYYEENGQLVGVARGSSGGFLLSYLLGITQIDPIKNGLSSARFLTLDRIQKEGGLPDIDFDMSSRDLLVGEDGNGGFLNKKYGNKAAQISTRTLLRLKSAILDANRFLNGEIEEEVQKLAKNIPNTPQGISDYDFLFGHSDADGNEIPGLIETNSDLKLYSQKRPQEWDLVLKAVSLTRQFSRHACSFAISSKPIEETIPIFQVGGVDRVTQVEHKQAEFAGIIKYDFLVVSCLKDIQKCLELINIKNNKKHRVGYFDYSGEKTYIWDLPHDEKVYEMLANGETETVFQFNTTSVTPFVKKIKPNSIIDLATVTSLCRPGPLDYIDEKTGKNMVEEYVDRKNGVSKGDIEILNSMIPETYAVLTYQEQISKIAKELGGMSVIDSENVRIAMGKKKIKLLESLKPKFLEGASKKIPKEEAEKIWSMMATFARYGFNCLSGDTKVLTENGLERLENVANSFYNYKVATFGKDGISFERPSFGVSKGIKKVLKVELEDGSFIEATEDHRFLCNQGFQSLKDIIKNNYILFPSNNADLKIKSIVESKEVEVFDISMPTNENFILENGVIAHNCSHAVAYSTISYACAFLKYHYPLEWWASVLTNADNKEINETFYKYVKDILMPPDINLSAEEISIDYSNGTLRQKLSAISGLGEKVSNKIVEMRPYKDLKDFVKKDPCGASMAKKLIYIGVMDSIMPKEADTILKKIYVYEQTVREIEFEEKLENLRSLPQDAKTIKKIEKLIQTGPKKAVIDDYYVGISPLKDYLIKKQICPTINLDLYALITKYSKRARILPRSGGPMILDKTGHEVYLGGASLLKKMDEVVTNKDVYFCVPGFVVQAEEFSYKKNTQKAYKMILDSSGYISEKVIWPDYKSGQLQYPSNLKKNSLAFVFYKKREGKEGVSIYDVIVEEEG